MTREGYNVEHLISILQNFKQRHPNLQIILEPGSAFAWRTGVLVSTVQDIVENAGVKTAMLDVSFACHMPDCLERPYKPAVRHAVTLEEEDLETARNTPHTYRIGGNSCLSGDFMGLWQFDHDLRIGEMLIFEDMIHYTTVKTNMFNGIGHPSIGMLYENGAFELFRRYVYEDYRDRMC